VSILELIVDRKNFFAVQAVIVLAELSDMFTSIDILSNRTGLHMRG
jgi:hypothetical protein